MKSVFDDLSPEKMLGAVEDAIELKLTGLAHPHTSYINRVYELQDTGGQRMIAKFYRPGRWSLEALQEEHDFLLDCEEAEIPVIPPFDLESSLDLPFESSTLAMVDQYPFAVFPKKWGRELEINDEESWLRIGRILGRLHLVGEEYDAPNRVKLHPDFSTRTDIEDLIEGEHVDSSHLPAFKQLCDEIMQRILPLFENTDMIRIHGDLHHANILDHPDDGIMLIDFDDMVTGPPIQDFWMLIPGNQEEARFQIDLMVEGYEEFRTFDWFSLKCIEALRLMRNLYFLAWCARQRNDGHFRHNFPDWGSYSFWEREIGELRLQLSKVPV